MRSRGELNTETPPPIFYILMKNGSIHSKILMSHLLLSHLLCLGCAIKLYLLAFKVSELYMQEPNDVNCIS